MRDLYTDTNKVHPNGTLSTRHLCTNVIVDIDESAGTATARSSFLVLQATPDAAAAADRRRPLPRQLRAGRRRVAVREREMGVEQVGDVHDHLAFDLSRFVDGT